MVDWTKAGQVRSSPAAPAGLKNTATKIEREQVDWRQAGSLGLQPWMPDESYMESARSWYGGANPDGTGNAWDNDFISEAFKQQNEWLVRANEKDPVTGLNKPSLFYDWLNTDKNPNATGVASWNDPSRGIKAGDVFVGGKKQEGQNLYEVFDEYTADVMLADLAIGPDVRKRLNKQGNVQAAYRTAITETIDANSKDRLYAPQQEEFASDTATTQAGMLSGWETPAIIGGAGATTGVMTAGGVLAAGAATAAVTGAATSWSGPVALAAGAAGFLFGAGSAWLNRDQLTEVAARATEVVKRSEQTGNWWDKSVGTVGFAAKEFGGGLGQRMINPVSNAIQGTYDVTEGELGDGESEFYAVNADGTRKASNWYRSLDFGAVMADSVLQFASPVGRLMYMTTMGAATIGGTTALTTGAGFNDRTGAMDDYENLGEWLSAVGVVGVDALQMGMGGAMAAASGRGRASFRQGDEAAPLMNRQVSLNAVRFNLDDAGRVVGDGKLTLELLAPSEFLKYQTMAWRARSMKARDAGAVTGDDLYQAGLAMQRSSTLDRAVVNAYAESAEEGFQGILEPFSFSETPIAGDVFESMLYGAASGAGMSISPGTRQVTAAEILESRNKTWYMMRQGLTELSDADWKTHYAGLNRAERERGAIGSVDETKRLREMWLGLEEGHRARLTRTSALGKAATAGRLTDKFDQNLAGANPKVSGSKKLFSTTADYMIVNGRKEDMFVGNSAVMSMWEMVNTLEQQLEGLRVQDTSLEVEANTIGKRIARPNITEAELANEKTNLQEKMDRHAATEGQVQMAEAMVGHFRGLRTQLHKATDPRQVRALVSQINNELKLAYTGSWPLLDGVAPTPQQQELLQRAIEVKLTRHPLIGRGSTVILMPQVSYELTAQNVHGAIYMHQSTLKVLGADHDGDDGVLDSTRWLDTNDRMALRRGAQYLIQTSPKDNQLVAPDPTNPELTIPARDEWVLEVDAPDDEQVTLERFEEVSRDQTTDGAKIVKAGLAELKQLLRERYSTRDAPIARYLLDPVLDEFEAKVKAGHKDARLTLANKIFNLNREGVLMLGDENHTPEIVWMMSEVTRTWDLTQQHLARLFLDEFDVDSIPKEEQRRIADERASQKTLAVRDAVNIGQTLSILIGSLGERAAQALHYSFYSSSVKAWDPKAGGFIPERVAELVEAYSNITSGETQSELDTLADVNSIEDRVVKWLADIASNSEDNATVGEIALLVANTRVPEMTSVNGLDWTPVDGSRITMLQMLLRRSLAIENNLIRKAPIDDVKRGKIAKFQAMSQAQEEHSYTAKTALLEVFKDFQVHQILGKNAMYLGPNMTLGQLEAFLLNMSGEVRTETLARWRRSPAYYSHNKMGDPPYSVDDMSPRDGTEPKINGYTMVVDALTTSAQVAGSNRAARNKTAQEAFLTAFDGLQTVLDQWTKDHLARIQLAQTADVTPLEILEDLMLHRPDVADWIVKTLPELSQEGIFSRHDGRLTHAKWLDAVLTKRDGNGNEISSDKAAVLYFVNSKIAEFNVMGGRVRHNDDPTDSVRRDKAGWRKLRDKRKLKKDPEQDNYPTGIVNPEEIRSRYLQTVYALAKLPSPDELNKFIRASLDAESLPELFKTINSNSLWLGGREELLPWYDDVAEFEADPKDLWNKSLPGSDQREAFAGWASGMKILHQTMVAEEAADAVDSDLLTSLKSYHDTLNGVGKYVPTSGVKASYAKLIKAIENRKAFPDANGRNARDMLLAMFQESFVAMHNKGSADDRAAGFGEPLITLDAFGIKLGFDQELDALTSLDWEDVMTNLTKLVDGPVRIMLDDGTLLRIDMSDPGQAIEMLADPRTRAFAKAVLFPTVRDINDAGVNQHYLDMATHDGSLPSSLVTLLDETDFGHLFDENGDRLEQAHRIIGLVESGVRKAALEGTDEQRLAAANPLQHILDDFLNGYSTAPFAENQDDVAVRNRLMQDVSEALFMISTLPDSEHQKVIDEVKARLKDTYLGTSEAMQRLLQTDVEKGLEDAGIRMLMIRFATEQQEMIRKEINRVTADLAKPNADRPTLEDQLKRLGDESIALSATLKEMTSNKIIGLPANSAIDVDSLIHEYQLTGDTQGDWQKKLNMLALLNDGNRIERFRSDKETYTLLNRVIEMANKQPLHLFDDTAFTQADWDVVAGWTAAAYIADATTRASSEVQLAPIILGKEGAQIRKYYDVTWGSLIDGFFDPAVLASMRMLKVQAGRQPEAVTSDAIVDRLFQTLLNPEKLGQWNDRIPIEGVKMRGIVKNASVGMAIPSAGNTPKEQADAVAAGWASWDLVPDQDPAKFDEHHSRVTITGAAGEQLDDLIPWQDLMKLENHFVKDVRILDATGAPHSLLQQAFMANHMHPDVAASGYKVFTVHELQEVLNWYLPMFMMRNFSVEIDFVDVDKKPFTAEWANNVYFDGVGREAISGQGGGAIAALFFGQGGLSKIGQQNPLDWLTKSGKSFRQVSTTKLDRVEGIEALTRPLSEILREKALLMLSKGDYETGYLLRADIPALYKMQKMRHVVIGVDAVSGVKGVMWAEEYISLETAGTAPNWDDIQLVPLSQSVMQTLLGKAGTMGKKGLLIEPLLNLQDAYTFPSLDLARLESLGLERIGEAADKGNTVLSRVAPLSRSYPRDDVKQGRLQRVYEEQQSAWDAAAAPVRTARAETTTGFKPRKFLRNNMTTLRDMLNSEAMAPKLARLGVPAEGMVNINAVKIAMHLQARIQKILDVSGGVLWIHVQDGKSNPTAGVFAKADHDSDFGGATAHTPIRGDIVTIDVDSFLRASGNNMEAAYEQAKGVVRSYAKRGVTVVIATNQGNNLLRGSLAEWLRTGQLGYVPIAGGAHFFEPASRENAVGATTEALNSTLTASTVFQANNENLSFVHISERYRRSENSRYLDPTDPHYRRVINMILPTQYTSTGRQRPIAFNLPINDPGGANQTRKATRLVLDLLSTPEGEAHLIKMSGGDPKMPLYRKLDNGIIEPGVLPIKTAIKQLKAHLQAGTDPLAPGEELMMGSLVVTVSPDGNSVLIVRVGFEPPRPRALGRQLETGVGNTKQIPGILGTNIAISTNKVNDAQTVPPPFKVREVVRDHRGVLVQGMHDIGVMGKAVAEGTGFKSGFSWWPKHLALPKLNLSANGRRITQGAAEMSLTGKNATSGLVRGFRWGFAVSGIDFKHDMIDFFLGESPTPRQGKEFTAAWNQVGALLNTWARIDHGLTEQEISRGLSANAFGTYASASVDELARKFMGAGYRSIDLTTQPGANEDPNKRLALVILATLAAPGVSLEHVISTPGVLQVAEDRSNIDVRLMPALMTDALNSVHYPALRTKLIGRMNDSFLKEADGTQRYFFDNSFNFYVVTQDENDLDDQGNPKREAVKGSLQLILDIPASQNPDLNVQARFRSKQDESQHVAFTQAASTGARTAVQRSISVEDEYEDSLVMRFDKEDETMFGMLRRVAEIDPLWTPWGRTNPLEQMYFDNASSKMASYLQPLPRDADLWTDDMETRTRELADRLLKDLGITKHMRNARVEVDYLVRQWYGAPAYQDGQGEFTDGVTPQLYLEAVQLMIDNVVDGMHPLHGGMVPLEHEAFLKMVFEANDARTQHHWAPLAKDGRKRVAAKSWDQWVAAVHGQMRESNYELNQAFRTDLDGFWHTYQGTTPSFNTIATSMDVMIAQKLRDPKTNERYVSMNPILAAAVQEPLILDSQSRVLDEMVGFEITKASVTDSRTTPDTGLAERQRRMASWLAGNKIKKQKRVTLKNYVADGVYAQEQASTTSNFFRGLLNLSNQRLLYPALWVSAVIEVPIRQGLEQMTNVLTGEYMGTGSAQVREGFTSRYTPEEVQIVRELAKMLGSDPEWMSNIFSELTYSSFVVQPGGGSYLGRGLERFSGFAARVFADPRFGSRGRSAALRYLEGVLNYYANTDSSISIAQLANELTKDPMWIQKLSSTGRVSAHSIGMSRVAQTRSMRNSALGHFVSGPIDHLVNSDRWLFQSAGVALKIPFMYSRFNLNQLMTLTGMDWMDQLIAIRLDGKRKGGFLQHKIDWAQGNEYDPTKGEMHDMQDVIDSMNLNRSVARSAISHTALFAAGTMAYSWGLGGEDEEARRRRRLSQYLNVPLQYDPREMENDFLYSEALFMDNMPFGIDTYFQDESGRSPIVPHWIVRQFTSPIMGVQRFLETGDPREVYHGFWDAASVIPYSVMNTWDDVMVTSRMLSEAAVEQDGNLAPEARVATNQLWINLVGVYEKALMESTFVNAIRNGSDQYDRNPWAVPKTMEDGSGGIQYQEGTNNKPLPTDSLVQFQVEGAEGQNDQNRMGYQTRTGISGQMHQYAENNATAALLMSLFSGQLGGGSTYARKNMVVVQRTVQLPETTQAEAEALIVSRYEGMGGQPIYTMDEIIRALKFRDESAGVRWDQANIEKQARIVFEAHEGVVGAMSVLDDAGNEVITQSGADSVYRSLRKGGISFKDASLQGISISMEMRDKIAKEWQEELIQEGVELGLSEESAKYRMKRLWLGDFANPEAPGLRELLYSNEIPRNPTQKYDQLNMTYMIGPDGKPWATPFQRANVLQSVFPAAHRRPDSGQGMTKDQTRGKDVDKVLGINTGLHGLVRALEEPIEFPPDSQMDAALAKTYTPSWTSSPYKKFAPFARRSFGSRSFGGGSGYSSFGPNFQRMNPLPDAQAVNSDGIAFLNVSNPYIRRSRINTERIFSERGRLKQWQ